MLTPQAPIAAPHSLSGTAADWLWLVPVLPLVGFLINGGLSLASAYHAGPADPGADGHGPDDAHAHEAAAHSHDEDHGATGDDHHPVKRHRFATVATIVGPAVLIGSFVLALMIFMAMVSSGSDAPFIQRYFEWMPVGDLKVDAMFQLDRLSIIMVLIITGVGSLIHLFSVGYMQDDPGYPRYFAYLNLFVAFMLVLVLGGNYPTLFVGWEGVGLCSYLLIGFWFSEKANADAGKKAFVVNRIGDFGFLIAMFLIFANLGSLEFATLGADRLDAGGPLVTTICLFLFLACCGKSAQIPLYTWLPDAMAGPTPVSALIHAATMVTAGVYLIARSSALFSLAPVACLTVMLVGALTAIMAASIGLKQWDIKKVLAYSTVSQLGYMFIGVGAGAYAAGMFHLVTHAFFKALLFLGSGSVIFAMHAAYHHTGNHDDAQDMRNMGGLKAYMPVTWVCMWIATLAIAGIPPFSGFFSKDEILGSVVLRAQGSTMASASWFGIPGPVILYLVYVLGLAAALMTAIYMTRMMLYTFHGPNRSGEAERAHLKEAPWIMTGPLVVLAILSALGGLLNLPAIIPAGSMSSGLERWLEPVIGESTRRVAAGGSEELGTGLEWLLIGVAVVVAITGVSLAWIKLKPESLPRKVDAVPATGFEEVLEHKYYVDETYDKIIVKPVVGISRGLLWRGIDAGLIDGVGVNGTAYLARVAGWIGSQMQSGRLGTYAWMVAIGVLLVLGAVRR